MTGFFQQEEVNKSLSRKGDRIWICRLLQRNPWRKSIHNCNNKITICKLSLNAHFHKIVRVDLLQVICHSILIWLSRQIALLVLLQLSQWTPWIPKYNKTQTRIIVIGCFRTRSPSKTSPYSKTERDQNLNIFSKTSLVDWGTSQMIWVLISSRSNRPFLSKSTIENQEMAKCSPTAVIKELVLRTRFPCLAARIINNGLPRPSNTANSSHLVSIKVKSL